MTAAMSVAMPEDTRPHSPAQPPLSSNNPFRNKTASPSQPSPQPSPVAQSTSPRTGSRNPFLDAPPSPSKSRETSQSSSTTMAPASKASATLNAAVIGDAAIIFDNLTVQDKIKPKPSNGMRPPLSGSTEKSRSENVPPRGHPMHRPSRSQEEAMRARKIPPGSFSRPRAPPGELNASGDPAEPRKSNEGRTRRNSDSSVPEQSGKTVDLEEEKKRQERRRRERRHREAGKDLKNKKPDRKLDIIDQLDATSIYGTGLFHHDGPFDACNPHRNRQGSRRAPMQAFPKDSLNNILGGGGPLNKRPDHATFLGNNDGEAFKDYAAGGTGHALYESYVHVSSRPSNIRSISTVQSSLQNVEPVHGDESLGLGTSTFLEGAPASKTAIQRGETEAAITPEFNAGLARKKSFAQKIRGMSNARREYPPPTGRVGSPDAVYSPGSPEPQTTPGVTRSKANESNPFFSELETNDEPKVERITIVEPETKPGPVRKSSSPPQRGNGERLERRITSDGTGEDTKPSLGFLSRVRSLKSGPRKTKPDKPALS